MPLLYIVKFLEFLENISMKIDENSKWNREPAYHVEIQKHAKSKERRKTRKTKSQTEENKPSQIVETKTKQLQLI